MDGKPSKWSIFVDPQSTGGSNRTLKSFFPATKYQSSNGPYGKSVDSSRKEIQFNDKDSRSPFFDLAKYRSEKENREEKDNDKLLDDILLSLKTKRRSLNFDNHHETPKKPRFMPINPLVESRPSTSRNLSSSFTPVEPEFKPKFKPEFQEESEIFNMAVEGLSFSQALEEEEEEEEKEVKKEDETRKPINLLTCFRDEVKPEKSKPPTQKITDNPLDDLNNLFDLDDNDEFDEFDTEEELRKEKAGKFEKFEMVEPVKPIIDNYQPDEVNNIDMYSLINVSPIKRITVEIASRQLPKDLIPVERIPEAYRSVFSAYKQFNIAQSKIFNDAFNTSKTMVISAPTGSGKTAIFELAIVRMLYLAELAQLASSFKVVYIAPLKTLCHERYLDWHKKFNDLGLGCVEMTSDSEDAHYRLLTHCSLIFATPEKWDNLVRFAGFDRIVKSIKLILIDEVHLLNDKNRGPKLEAIITRFKALQRREIGNELDFRFIAVSATAPNTDDMAQWLGDDINGAVCYNLDDRFRSVKLTKKVFGYNCPDSVNDFFFIQKLNYKLPSIIKEFSKGRPTLIFVCTRRDCQTTAEFLAKESAYCCRPEQKNTMYILAKSLGDNKLKATLLKGIGFHHAGLTPDDRHKLEVAFLDGVIPVLIATSTLAMGVNFPAHLVIIKGTSHYVSGSFVEYGESEILQMMGRAGRPQFDDHGYAIILTKDKNESKYKKLVSGEKVIESNIHQSLAEIFMAEIERHTITTISQAVEWVQSTFFHIRVHKNKQNYALDPNWTEERVEQKVRDICVKELNGLKKYKLIEIDGETGAVKATEIGRMMAIKSISYQTMCTFMELKGSESLRDLLIVLTKCRDINQDVNLRNSEKKHLNQFNTRSKTETNRVIRFPFSGKIKTKEMKINVLIQATLGCIPFSKESSSLLQETGNIMRVSQRLSRCLVDVAMIKATNLKFLLNCIILAKCLRAGIWENSKFVAKQLPKIGLELSSRLVDADLTSFQRIEAADPRTIEMFCRRHITFGEFVIKESQRIPKYTVTIERARKTSAIGFPQAITIKIHMTNWEIVKNDSRRIENHACVLLIGDQDHRILEKQRIFDRRLIKENGLYERFLNVPPVASSIFIHYIDDYYVGTDISLEYLPKYLLTNEQETVRRIQAINQCDNIFKPSPSRGKKPQKDTPGTVRFTDELDEIQLSEDEEIQIFKPKPKQKPKPKPKPKPKEPHSDVMKGIDGLYENQAMIPELEDDYSYLMDDDDMDLPTDFNI
ncbi:probable ATP-dependent DNA helicase HFM1 [Panonychus citri]|uniref:probable ATP-dependent DNA helicase HFM1 n=1 Tax=Panonychus citri TaxID=50023 RepID=UPI0023074CB5|nr:probable ATP-dependent DNA helicase HFM1 [Panonychus citri]